MTETSIDWATRHFDRAGGFEAFRDRPENYRPRLVGGGEPIKMIEAAAEVIRLREIPDLDAYMHNGSIPTSPGKRKTVS